MKRPGLCLDATGTLIEASQSVGEVYRQVALDFGVELPAERLDAAFRRVLRRAPARASDANTPEERRQAEVEWWTERIHETFEAADSSVHFDDFGAFAAALFESYREPGRWRPRAEVVATLRELARQGFSMLVVSNFDHRLPKILQDIEITGFFEAILIPAQFGWRKPDRRLFELAAERLASSLENLVYVGDDAPAVLEAIGAQGVRVIDVDRLKHFAALPECLAQTTTRAPSDRHRCDG